MLRRLALGTTAFFAAAWACSDAPPVAEIVIAIQTDVALPDSIDAIRVEVSTLGKLEFGSDYPVGPGRQLIPATLGVLRGKEVGTPVLMRLIAKKGGLPKMVRDVTTTIPAKIATLRLPIRWLCDDSAKVGSGDVVDSTCPAGQTCIGGECLSSAVDSAMLPVYASGDVFGGGTGGGDGSCFDVVGCMVPSAPVTPDADCTIPKPAGGAPDRINIALGVTNDGICDDARQTCFVILDQGVGGWTEQAGRLALPRAVCRRLASGRVKGVLTSSSCPTKTELAPVCGPWSSVGSTSARPTEAGTTPPSGAIAQQSGVVFSTEVGGCVPRLVSQGIFYCGLNSLTQTSTVYLKPLNGTRPATEAATIDISSIFAGPLVGTDGAWWVVSTPSAGLTLMTAALDGTRPREVRTVALSFWAPVVAMDDTRFYTTRTAGEASPLYAWPKDGATPFPIAAALSDSGLSPSVVLADGTPGGAVHVATRAPAGETAPATIESFAKGSVDAGAAAVTGVAGAPIALLLDGDVLWFIVGTKSGGQLYKLPLSTRTPSLVATIPGLVTRNVIAADGKDVYFVANRSSIDAQRALFRVAKAGGPLKTVATGIPADQPIESVMVADDALYCTASRYGSPDQLAGFLYKIAKPVD